MRIAVSGTHCCGKSTLINDFLLRHPDFDHEPEPYAVLVEQYGEVFAAEPTLDDFYRQLEFNVDRLRRHRSGDRVIYERCPVDFLAYSLALCDLGRPRDTERLVEDSLAIVSAALDHLDLIVFLPLDDLDDGSTIPDSEDSELRSEVNSRLVGIFYHDDLNVFATNRPAFLEARGSTAQRLKTLESFLGTTTG